MNTTRTPFSLFLVTSMVTLLLSPAESYAQGLSIGGYFQNWYVIHKQDSAAAGHPGLEHSTSGFWMRRARLIGRASLDDVFSLYALTDLAQRDRILIDATISARFMPELTVTIGQMMAPAQMHETSLLLTSNMLLFERSDVAIQLSRHSGYDLFRDVGVMVSGRYSIAGYGLFAGNGLGRFSSASSSFLHRRLGQGLFGGRIDLEPVKGLFIGGHAAFNRQDSVLIGTKTTTAISSATPPTLVTTAIPDIVSRDRTFYSFRLAADGAAVLPDLLAECEYGRGRLRDAPAMDIGGWYAQFGYWITPDVLLLGRYDTYEEELLSPSSVRTNSNITGGLLYFYRKDGKEIVRIGLNHQSRRETPVELRNDVLVAWMQIRF